jgi:hypothetical protein
MIPSDKTLSGRLSPWMIEFILTSPTNYFAIADEYVSLQKIFVRETVLDKVNLWIEMLVSPIITLLFAIKKGSIDFFAGLSLHKCGKLWLNWFRWKELQGIIREWVKIVRSTGGPYISSNDAEYHMFVYADGMQRIYNSLSLLISEKRAKRAK